MKKILVCDIGGTHARAAIAQGKKIVKRKTFHSNHFSNAIHFLEFALLELGDADEIRIACAGPVIRGVCTMTNLGWRVDAKKIEKKFGRRVRLVNDVEAMALAIAALSRADLSIINEGKKYPGAQVVVSAGTGLGQAAIIEDKPVSSEGGHADFAPTTAQEIRLHAFLQRNESLFGIPFTHLPA